jgi:hypothetical protein
MLKHELAAAAAENNEVGPLRHRHDRAPANPTGPLKTLRLWLCSQCHAPCVLTSRSWRGGTCKKARKSASSWGTAGLRTQVSAECLGREADVRALPQAYASCDAVS